MIENKGKGEYDVGMSVEGRGGQEVSKGGRKNRYDQSSLGTRMKFSIKKFQTSKYVAFKKIIHNIA